MMHRAGTPPGMVAARMGLFGLVLGACLAHGSGQAQTGTKLKPGLWEHSYKLGSASGKLEAAMKEAQAALAQMPPEQRKMMEQMLAKQGMGLGADGQKLRLCLSPEDVARDEPPPAQDGCKQTSKRQGNTWTISFQCPARNGEGASSGNGTLTLKDPGNYEGRFTVTTSIDGKPEQMQMSTSGRWISADCGNLRRSSGRP